MHSQPDWAELLGPLAEKDPAIVRLGPAAQVRAAAETVKAPTGVAAPLMSASTRCEPG